MSMTVFEKTEFFSKLTLELGEEIDGEDAEMRKAIEMSLRESQSAQSNAGGMW